MSRQSKGKVKTSSSVNDRPHAAPADEPDRDDDDIAASFSPDLTILGDHEGPPLEGKTLPRETMDGAVPSLDDEHRSYRHHPSENEAFEVEVEVEVEVGDAAADLAADLGSQFLEGATRGEDFGSRVLTLDDDSDAPLDLLLDEDDESTGEAPLPARPVGRRRAG